VPDRIMREAVNNYLFADDAPAIAAGLKVLHARLRAAGAALRALIAALERIDAVQSHPSRIKLLFPALLKAHQRTWTDVVDLTRWGITDPILLSTLDAVWTGCLLKILIDRTERSARSEIFDGVPVVRIFGTMSPALTSEMLFLTDGHVARGIQPKLPADYHDDPSSSGEQFPFRDARFLLQCDLHGMLLARSLTNITAAQRALRPLYCYGPIGDFDLEISLDALRDCAAAMAFVAEGADSMARLFATAIKDKSCALGSVVRHGISPTAFARALAVHRRVETHAIETALARFRKQQAGSGANATEKRRRPRKKVSPKKTVARTAKRPITREKTRAGSTGR